MENIKYIDITQLPDDLWQDAKNLIALDSNGEVIKAQKQDSYTKDEIDDLLKDAEISADKLQNKIKINSASTDYVVTQPTVSGDSLVLTDSMSDKNQYHTFGYDKTITTTSNRLLGYSTPLFRGTNEYNCPQWDGNSIRFTNQAGMKFNTRLTIPYTYNGVKYVTHFEIDIRNQMYTLNFGVISDKNFVGYQAVKFKESEVYKAFGANVTFVFKTNNTIKDYAILSPSINSTYDFIYDGMNIEMSIGNFPLTSSNGELIIETPRFYIYYNNVLMGDVPTESQSSDHPERLNDYIRYSNDVKAYILTDKNTKFKTINGEQITGNGNIEISTDVDLSNLATKAELNTKQDVISDLDSIRSGAAKGATALQSVPSGYATEQWVNEQGFLKEHQDISNLATKSELATKQDTLVSGTNIKTVNGTSLLGSGDITIDTNVDLYDYYTKSETNALVNPKLEQVTLTQAEYDALQTKENNVLYVISDAEDIKFKTINGAQITGEGNIEVATKSELNAKQDVISDLDTIRSGAAKGATALQSVPSGYATEQWVNEQGFLKEHQDISNLATKAELNTKQDVINDLQTIRSGAAKGATALQSVPDTYALKSEIPDISTKQDKLVSGTNIKTVNGESLLGSGNIVIEASAENVPTVQTTVQGTTSNYIYSNVSYSDNKYGVVTDISNFITYSTDKATIATYTRYWGEESSNTYQNWSINAATTSKAGLMSASDKTKLDGIDLSTKQDTLVSGTNIKTINGTSLLGSGNITIDNVKEWVGTQAEYNALTEKDNNTTYYITE